MEEKKDMISLDTIGGGVAHELFDTEFQKVLENILDPNTEATAVREIVLKFKIKPEKKRTKNNIQVFVGSKLGPMRAYETQMYIGRNGDGNIEASEFNPEQIRFQFEKMINTKTIGGPDAEEIC